MDPNRRLTTVGLVTLALVALPPLLAGQAGRWLGLPWLGAILAFLIFFVIATHPRCRGMIALLPVAGQAVAALIAVGTNPSGGFEGVLLVVVAGQLGSLPFQLSIGWVAVQTLLLGAVFFRLSGHFLVVTLAYCAFEMFALFTAHVAHSEAEARLELAAANAELKVAAGLLDLNSRTSERLRIARDLHDLLGHHLTALTLNLEIAGHVANAEAKTPIETSRSIAKHLLADVRDVVSRLRDDEPLDLAAALAALPSVITAPALHLDLAPGLTVRDSALAQITLRAVEEIVTNAVRHSGARNLWVSIATADGTLTIDAHDDGEGVDHVRFGNGLQGMRERVTAAHGTMEVTSMRGRGFRVEVRIPL